MAGEFRRQPQRSRERANFGHCAKSAKTLGRGTSKNAGGDRKLESKSPGRPRWGESVFGFYFAVTLLNNFVSSDINLGLLDRRVFLLGPRTRLGEDLLGVQKP